MPIIEDAELPIASSVLKGKGVDSIKLRKEDNHRDVLTLNELLSNFESVKARLSADLKQILAT